VQKHLLKHLKQCFYQSKVLVVQVFTTQAAIKLRALPVLLFAINRRQLQTNRAFGGLNINDFAPLCNDQSALRYQLRSHCTHSWHSRTPGCGSGVHGAGYAGVRSCRSYFTWLSPRIGVSGSAEVVLGKLCLPHIVPMWVII
jgi:hypothetical protein